MLLNKYLSPIFINLLIAFGLAITISFAGCMNETKETKQSGSALAKQYCGTCHVTPSPNLLDRKTWEKNVLPNMAPRMGIEVYGGNNYVFDPYDSTASISYANWMQIVKYYTKSASEKLPAAKAPDTVVRDWSVFKLKIPTVRTE